MRGNGFLPMGLIALVTACTMNCTDAGCIGKKVTLELVDDAGEPVVAARGELSYSHHSTKPFDCSIATDGRPSGFGCESGVLTLEPIYNPDDTIKVRFELDDGTLTDWQPVEVEIEKRVLRDFNGPDCDCTVYDGTTKPVTVPDAAR